MHSDMKKVDDLTLTQPPETSLTSLPGVGAHRVRRTDDAAALLFLLIDGHVDSLCCADRRLLHGAIACSEYCLSSTCTHTCTCACSCIIEVRFRVCMYILLDRCLYLLLLLKCPAGWFPLSRPFDFERVWRPSVNPILLQRRLQFRSIPFGFFSRLMAKLFSFLQVKKVLLWN